MNDVNHPSGIVEGRKVLAKALAKLVKVRNLLVMSDNEAKALELVAEAEKKLNSSKSFLGGLFG